MKLSSIAGVKYNVKDLQKTTAFYESLGFRVGAQTEETATCYVNWFWVTFTADPSQPAHDSAGQFLYIKVDDIDAYYKEIVASGLKPEGEPQKQPSGMVEFTLKDPDGYNLVFFYKK